VDSAEDINKNLYGNDYSEKKSDVPASSAMIEEIKAK